MNILISGASSGVGRAIAERCLTDNHQVIGLVRDVNKFKPGNANYQSVQIDFAKIESLETTLKAIQKNLNPIDVIICCAGFGQFCELEQFSVQQMQAMMDVNFLSQAILIKSFLPNLKKQGRGKILVMGSECALQGAKKASLYAASKFALRGFCQSLQAECASANVAVSLINSGLIDTPFFDQLNFRPGNQPANAIKASQVTDLVMWLLSLDNNCVMTEVAMQPMQPQIEKT